MANTKPRKTSNGSATAGQGNDLARFDFDGLDRSALVHHADHGPCIQSDQFIRWIGWSNPAAVRRDHLRPGDEVSLVTSTKRGRGKAMVEVKHLTKRGVRRILMRSNHPNAVEYADQVLDFLDELDRSGMVVDAERITDDQIDTGIRRLSTLQQKRLEERMDYKVILHALKEGGAVSEEYAAVQNFLYLSLFGMTAATIRATQPQRTGEPRKRGEGLLKSNVAKDYLTEPQLDLLNSVVLATFSQVRIHYRDGASSVQIMDCIARAVEMLGVRRPLAS